MKYEKRKKICVLTPFWHKQTWLSNVIWGPWLRSRYKPPWLWEPKDLNVGFTVEVEDKDAEMVAAAIPRSGDYECFEDVPFWDFKTGQWRRSPSYAKWLNPTHINQGRRQQALTSSKVEPCFMDAFSRTKLTFPAYQLIESTDVIICFIWHHTRPFTTPYLTKMSSKEIDKYGGFSMPHDFVGGWKPRVQHRIYLDIYAKEAKAKCPAIICDVWKIKKKTRAIRTKRILQGWTKWLNFQIDPERRHYPGNFWICGRKWIFFPRQFSICRRSRIQKTLFASTPPWQRPQRETKGRVD